MSKDLITIIITSYNKEKYIKKSIRSALNQSYKKKEVIVFDDYSSDNSISIIRKIKNIKLVINKDKKKKSSPLNQINAIMRSLTKARGKYIFLLDGDDEFKNDKVEKLMKYFKQNIHFKMIQDKPSLRNRKNFFNFKKKNHFFSIWPSIYPTSCIAIKKDYFLKFLKFIEKNKYGNLEIDSRLVIYAFLNNDLKILDNSFTYYNIDNYGISSKYIKFNKNWWKKRNEAFDYMQNLSNKLNLKFFKGPDYIVTKILNLFF